MAPQILEVDLRGQRAADPRLGRRGEEHLAAMRGGAQARHPLDVEAHVAVADHLRRAGVHGHARGGEQAVRPGMGPEGALGGERGRERLRRLRKDAEERIALGAELVAACGPERVAEQGAVVGVQRGIAVAELQEQPGRALDVGEEQGDGAGR